MSINLIESKRRSQKSVRGTFVSIGIHAALITVAVYATASASEVHRVPVEAIQPLYPPQSAAKPSTQGGPARHRSSSAALDKFPVPPFKPVVVCQCLLPVDALPPVPGSGLFATATSGAGDGSSAPDSGLASGEPLLASQVEKPAIARSGNPFPRYPSLLESSRVEGSVLVQFVVDTLGRADMSTFRVLAAANELFAQSLESTLPKWRFYPAEASGRKVKQIVQLPLKFVASHY